MACRQCENGKWRWNDGPCLYKTRASCEEARRRRRVVVRAAKFLIQWLEKRYGDRKPNDTRGA